MLQKPIITNHIMHKSLILMSIKIHPNKFKIKVLCKKVMFYKILKNTKLLDLVHMNKLANIQKIMKFKQN